MTNPVASNHGLDRVEPQLRDLLALAGSAARLPPWSRGLRAQQSGQYLSRVRGRGMEYDESRPYQPGDDIRQLDWRVTARTGKPHTKLFREERERPVFVAVDYSPALFFATRGVFKAVQAARLASLLAWRAQSNGDRVGGIVFSPTEHHELAPRRGKAAVIRLLKLLASEAPRCRQAAPRSGANALTEALTRLKRLAKPGSLVFVVSDFRDLDATAASALARLAAHTDLGLIAVYDALEAEFPALDHGGAIRDAATTLRLPAVTTDQRARYAEQFAERQEQLRQLAREQRVLFTSVDTTGDPVATLLRLLAQ